MMLKIDHLVLKNRFVPYKNISTMAKLHVVNGKFDSCYVLTAVPHVC